MYPQRHSVVLRYVKPRGGSGAVLPIRWSVPVSAAVRGVRRKRYRWLCRRDTRYAPVGKRCARVAGFAGPTITVSGTCTENIVLNQRERLTIQGALEARNCGGLTLRNLTVRGIHPHRGGAVQRHDSDHHRRDHGDHRRRTRARSRGHFGRDDRRLQPGGCSDRSRWCALCFLRCVFCRRCDARSNSDTKMSSGLHSREIVVRQATSACRTIMPARASSSAALAGLSLDVRHRSSPQSR